MPSIPTNSRRSAVPTFYYVVFGIIEPLITFASLLEGIFDPETVCILTRSVGIKIDFVQVIDRHGRWSDGFTESEASPPTVHAIVCQIVVAHAVIGCVNASV